MSDRRHLALFDRKTGTVEQVVPIQQGLLRVYTCGPTVYSHAHIGNFRSFLTADLLVRVANAIGYSTNFICNITDVGHLTEDSFINARGEDKLTKAWRDSGSNQFHCIWDMARAYTEYFLEDWRALNLIEPDVRPRASEHITEQLEMIAKLVARGYAYETPLGVYFDIKKWPSYGALSGNKTEQLEASGRDLVEDPQRKSSHDFALWKKDPNHLMRWYSPYGWGYPGWHIECSAMAIKYLGEELDVHTGGEDNRFPHHECELAQSEAVSNRRFVRHWLHTAHLRVNGRKMAKSDGDSLTVRNVLSTGADPLALRLALIGARYRDPLNFTDESLVAAIRVRERVTACFESVIRRADGLTASQQDMPIKLTALYDACLEQLALDLNMPGALRYVHEGIRHVNSIAANMSTKVAQGCLAWFEKVNELTGLIYGGPGIPKIDCQSLDPKWIDEKISEREVARERGQFDLADRIRDELSRSGVEIVDSIHGSRWKMTGG